jgi:isoprenylcysteine carboxyl methyltransferase (ICMT) family protein YpbQ
MWFLLVFVLALSFRLWTLSVSLRHEKALKAAGATEFDTTNSMLLAIVHALFYLAALLEAFIRRPASTRSLFSVSFFTSRACLFC